jgi:hypothetical protein
VRRMCVGQGIDHLRLVLVVIQYRANRSMNAADRAATSNRALDDRAGWYKDQLPGKTETVDWSSPQVSCPQECDRVRREMRSRIAVS